MKKQVEIEAKYEGYILRQKEMVEKFRLMEGRKLPREIDYAVIPGLSNEMRKKLSVVQPESVGQALRIPRVTQAALTALLVYLKRKRFSRRRDGKTG